MKRIIIIHNKNSKTMSHINTTITGQAGTKMSLPGNPKLQNTNDKILNESMINNSCFIE
jgi:hypothetical protein